tara:strand:- start:329 stop:724 length:396 start_codon:yes stop_codon:yes gene_type:complete
LTENIIGWGPAVFWAGVLFLLTIWDPSGLGFHYGGNDTFHLPLRADKIVHIGLYLVFGLLLEWGRVRTESGFSVIFLILLGLGYGILNEWFQMFLPNREMNLSDGLANSLGVLMGFGIYKKFLPYPRQDNS